MEVKNSVVPHQEQITGFFEPGHEAYGIYSAAMFAADVEKTSLGEVEELWDEVAIAMHPSLPEISTHRAAGLVGQLNRETAAPKRASQDQT